MDIAHPLYFTDLGNWSVVTGHRPAGQIQSFGGAAPPKPEPLREGQKRYLMDL